MKVFQVIVFLMISNASAFDTVITKPRELQVAVAHVFNLYFFTCGKEVYRCGRGQVNPQFLCPTPAGTMPATGKITIAQCNALTAEARKNMSESILYKRGNGLCPNGKNVVNHVKYTTLGAGRYCRPKKACICCYNGEVGGDPHFLTYDGTPYSYHGQCDLVMAQSKEFANGLGLHVHARTEIIEDMWSLISNAAVKIGTEVIEMTNEGDIYFNGKQIIDLDNDLPSVMSDNFNITRVVNFIGKDQIQKTDLNIALYEGEKKKIRLTLFKRLLAVHVGAVEEDISGMLGHRISDGLLGRDGVSIMNSANEMGQEWQVTDQEPMLFHEIKAPQYPQQCKIPEVTSRRKLRTNVAEHRRRASEACSGITDERKLQFCIEDMILTGDPHIADMYKHSNHDSN